VVKDIETLLCKARAYVELNQENEAIDCINTFLAREPHNHLALACKGDILEKLGRKAEALQCYKKSVEMNSQRVYVWHKIANIKNESGDHEAALEYYNEAVQIVPGFEEAWYKIGQILSNENKNEQAKECFSWVLEINPDNVKAKRAISFFEGHHGILDALTKKEKGKSKGQKSRKPRKAKKKRKMRKRKTSKEHEYHEAPSEELLYEEEVYYENSEVKGQYEEAPSQEGYTEVSQVVYEDEIQYEEELPSEETYGEDESYHVSDEVYGEYENYQETVELEGEVNKASKIENGEFQDQYEEPNVEDLFTKSDEYNDEPTDSISESSDDSDEIINELEELADYTETYPETPEAELSDNVIDNEIQSLESDMHEDHSLDKSDANINELEDLLEEAPPEGEISENNEGPDPNEFPENDLIAEAESQEEELESYGDLGSNLNELEQLLIEKSDYLNNAKTEVQSQEEINEETISEELPTGEDNDTQETSSDDNAPGLEDLKSQLNDLQDLMVSDSTHLDGQVIGSKLSCENKLDGQKIPSQADSHHLDAYSSDYAKQSELKASLDNLVNQGKMHMQQGEFQQAMNCFDMALKLDPQCLEAWGAKGDLLLEMDKEEDE
jgi:tetratricopeptide (TPR) repeat protein